jgi:hypothetical protein
VFLALAIVTILFRLVGFFSPKILVKLLSFPMVGLEHVAMISQR